MSAPRKRVGVLISGRGSNLAALIEAAKNNDYPAEIALVLSNRPDAAGLTHAGEAGIATAVVDHKSFAGDREAFERALDASLREHDIEIVCLAGFMRLLTPWFVDTWAGRMINVHPALLPSFRGLDTHARAIEAGVKLHGATVHYVTSDMDAGPIIMQGAVPVLSTDDEKALAARVLGVEHQLYPQALALIASGRTRIEDGRVVVSEAAEAPAPLVWPA
ncbi:phosphoribosylglycinamide formyltransferase-1 [Breoghania corrubedonensis]|uniref:Phosphoribosylglycinamide formyltransferase n=1 Tax=Breoghania corrubedonensis TaxID=665038 RepID=A0A2T5V8E6_9HYPH|nr:phosphoribosylglycinamide formyltransferase [Breoghania corrubedonensis]PTW60026.1 phosphoribosylglycinamide formyltransferase-1 [Breoghania corrubedonensis]